MLALPGIRLARARHLREIEAIANHPACRGFLVGRDGRPVSARRWFEAGVCFYLFDGGWLAVVPREDTEADLHIAALPGYRGPHVLAEGLRIVGYLLDEGSPFKRLVAIVNRRNRAVRSLLSAAGFEQVRAEGEIVEYRIERTN